MAIDGLGASGKSTLAAALARQCRGHVISLDDFSQPGTPTWEHDRFVEQVLTPLRAGRTATYQLWRWDSSVPTATATVPTGTTVFVEGVSVLTHTLVSRVGRWWDLSFWLDCDEAVRRRRIMRRDDADTHLLWERSWWPSERAYVAVEDPRAHADFVLCAPDQDSTPSSR